MHGGCTRGQSTRRTSLSEKAHPGDHAALGEANQGKRRKESGAPSGRQHALRANEPIGVRDQDDFVVERYTASGTHQGPLGDLQPTNRTATWTGINIFRISCGRIVEVWSEVDAEDRTRQLTLPLTSPGR